MGSVSPCSSPAPSTRWWARKVGDPGYICTHWGQWNSYDALCKAAHGCRPCCALRDWFRLHFSARLEEEQGDPGQLDHKICSQFPSGGKFPGQNTSFQLHFLRSFASVIEARSGDHRMECIVILKIRKPFCVSGINDLKIISSGRSLLVSSICKETQLDFDQQRPLLPTRILDLGRDKKSRGLLDRFGSNIPPHPFLTASIRLVSPAHGSIGQYLTLSHRWGKNQHFTLTKTSLKSFHGSISFESLPKTFQDAVILTRKLGYQYLWIDALCIVQDDLEEWQEQAPKMASVYHNSTCTIAAHSAKNDSEGFLAAAFERIPSILLRRRPLYTGASHSIPKFRSLYLGSSFKDQVNESFLTQRGWVFQERILSRRILHFTRHHVFFEDGFVVRTVDARLSPEPLTHSPREDTKFMIEDIVATSADCYKLVERYSTCALTFDRDRLPAIAGIAAFVQTYDPGDEYLYGIWRNSLQQGLLWVAADNAPQEVYYGSTPSPPSWSWARWKGSIRFPLQIATFQPLFQHTDDSIHFDNAHSNANLAKKSRFLSIRAEVMELQDVSATIINRPPGQFSFEPPMHRLYNINSKKLGIVN